jgi:hypothetical protein
VTTRTRCRSGPELWRAEINPSSSQSKNRPARPKAGFFLFYVGLMILISSGVNLVRRGWYDLRQKVTA